MHKVTQDENLETVMNRLSLFKSAEMIVGYSTSILSLLRLAIDIDKERFAQ